MNWSKKSVAIMSAMVILAVVGTWVVSNPRETKRGTAANPVDIEVDLEALFSTPESEFKWERFDSDNTPFTDCNLGPELADPSASQFAQGKVENQLLYLTLITRLLIAKNVERTQDCSCAGKSIFWADVVRYFEALERRAPEGKLVSWEQSETYAHLTPLQSQIQYSCHGGL